MLPFSTDSLEITIREFSNYYIRKYGREKYEKVLRKTRESNKLAALDGKSIRERSAPSSMDFLAVINTIPYFIFSSQETCALAAISAISLWNEKINSKYFFCDSYELDSKARTVFNLLKLS